MNLQSDFISPPQPPLTPSSSQTSSETNAASNSIVSEATSHGYSLMSSSSSSTMTKNRNMKAKTALSPNRQSPLSSIIPSSNNSSIRPSYITINNSNTSAINNTQVLLSSSPSSSSSSSSSSASDPAPNTVANMLTTSTTTSSTTPASTSPSSSSKNMSHLAQEIVDLLRRLNVRLVAFDFDYTLVTIHTGGQWLDSPEKLAEFVRPCFRDLLPVLLKAAVYPDLNVCVVTYSPQERLIREVLRISLKDEHDVNDLVNKIIIKGNTKEFLERHGIDLCYANGKQVHIDYCRNYLQLKNASSSAMSVDKIDDSNILLIDDDIQNIRLAMLNGHYAFHVDNNMKLVDLYNFLKDRVESFI